MLLSSGLESLGFWTILVSNKFSLVPIHVGEHLGCPEPFLKDEQTMFEQQIGQRVLLISLWVLSEQPGKWDYA